MRILMNDAHSYASYDNAVTRLKGALQWLGIEDARCLIVATDTGRFVPAVLQSSIDPMHILPLVHRKISVVG